MSDHKHASMTTAVEIKTQTSGDSYRIILGENIHSGVGEWALDTLGRESKKTAIISNKKVFGLYGEQIVHSLELAGFKTCVHLIGDGERFKSLNTLRSTLEFLGTSGISRTDAVVALGGGVVGDLTGFAASIYLRGIAFLQVPTTLLSMIDSSVGGKTGINASFGKNIIGSFYQPRGVMIDTASLSTLPRREITAGLCEAVKQGALSGTRLLQETDEMARILNADEITRRAELPSLIASQVSFKANIVANDEKEDTSRTDTASRKILNFGHTLAHALEAATNYRYLKHGEAVGYGVLYAASLSKKLGLLPAEDVKLLMDSVRCTGKLPSIKDLDPQQVFEAFKFDKKVIGNSLQWILLEGIGKPIIFPHSQIPDSVLRSAFKELTSNL